MGFNDWAHYGCNINQQLFVNTANELVATGLAKDGYRYVNIDDCWPAMSRNAQGQLVANPQLFPNGLKWLGDYLHARGLKFGIYEDAGTSTCGGYPGSWDHFQQDAETFASWGVDYLKLDGCNVPSVPGQTAEQTYQYAYTEMSQALKATGRPIIFSESAPAYFYGSPGFTQIMSWIGHEGNLWRFGSDIADNWASVLTNYSQDNSYNLASYAGPGHWNDPDMLEVNNSGLTYTEQQSQFSLWAEMAAPLLISTDMTNLSQQALSILSNKAVIAVDQDPYGAQGTIVKTENNVDILAKPLANGDIAVVLFNKGDTPASAAITAHDAGFSVDAPAYLLDNLWTGQVTETSSVIAANIPAHGVVMYRVRPTTRPTVDPPSVVATLEATAHDLTATATDYGRLPAQDLSVQPNLPTGWAAQPTSGTALPLLAPGSTQTVSWSLTPPSLSPGQTYDFGVTFTYRWPSAETPATTSASQTYTAPFVAQYTSLQQAFNNVGVTDNSNPTPGDFDGSAASGNGNSYSAEALAAVGITPGGTVSGNGVTFTWPDLPAGVPDNVNGGQPSIAFSGSGSSLALLGSSTYNYPGTTGAITYTDGTVQFFTLSFPGWFAVSPPSNAVACTQGRNTQQGFGDTEYYYCLFEEDIPLLPGKQIAVVTLPQSQSEHVFAMAVKS